MAESLLLGLSEGPRQHQRLFLLFLSAYLVLAGALLIALATATRAQLHAPMNFFLADPAFVDICFTSTTVPKMPANPTSGPRDPLLRLPDSDALLHLLAGVNSLLLTAVA